VDARWNADVFDHGKVVGNPTIVALEGIAGEKNTITINGMLLRPGAWLRASGKCTVGVVGYNTAVLCSVHGDGASDVGLKFDVTGAE
jgi:hypothetical protein